MQPGARDQEKQEARILNRVVRWIPLGWEYEADQRHAELIVQAMGVDQGHAVATPGEEPAWRNQKRQLSTMREIQAEEVLLGPEESGQLERQ